MKLMEGKVALLTGAAGGIGAASAIKFAKEGAKAIYIVDMAEEKAEATLAEVRKYCDAYFMKADVTKEDRALEIYEQVKKEQGRLDVLVACAGITSVDKLHEVSLDRWNKVMDINLTGTFIYSRIALAMMKEQNYGRIVLFSSISGQVGGIRTNPAYACSKAGISCLTKSLAKDGAAQTVTVNAVAPGIAATDMIKTDGFHCSSDEVPMGYLASPEEVADVVLFLSSDMSRYVTGQTISVNGGMFMGF